MIALALLRRQWLLSLVYVATASLAVEFTRREGGVAQLWSATAVLLAALIRPRRGTGGRRSPPACYPGRC